MKFGVRECANIVFRAKTAMKIGLTNFKPGQPVLYIDTAKTSTLEGSSETTYATGGRGNTKLISWEGEKTLTFTVEDALISPIGLAILSGAGLVKKDNVKVHVHTTAYANVGSDSTIDLTNALGDNKICKTAPIFIVGTDSDGSLNGTLYTAIVKDDQKGFASVATGGAAATSGNVFADFYVLKDSADVSEIQIDADVFRGNFYVEADTLFRTTDGLDIPANITIPNVKIQSNFNLSLSSTGDPSSFTFTMDAFPDYTYFNKTKKVLCVIQTIDDATAGDSGNKNETLVMSHEGVIIEETKEDSNTAANGVADQG